MKDRIGHIQVQRKCCFLAEEIRKFMIVQIEAAKIENGG